MFLHRGDLEFQPGTAGQLHFGLEPKQVIGLECLHAPEIHRISDAKINRVATAAPQPHAADQEVEQCRGAARASSHSTSRSCRRCAGWGQRPRRLGRATVAVRESTIREPNRTPPHRGFTTTRRQGIGPAGFRKIPVFVRAAPARSLRCSPRGRIGKASKADGSSTTVGFRRPSTSFRPIRA